MPEVKGLQSGIQSALAGIQRELKSAAENASKIANFQSEVESDGDLVKPIVDLKANLRQVSALRRVVNITQDMEDEVLDIIA